MPPKLVTIGRIADECDVPIHRVRHILATRSHIQPAAFAGLVRLYRADAIAMVRHEIHTINARRDNPHNGESS
jgi:predicted transcriptional regulator